MTAKVFISGSISITTLPGPIIDSVKKIVHENFEILIGDAPGVDTFIQQYCSKHQYYNVTVYSIFDSPRYQANEKFRHKKIEISREIKKERERQQQKDQAMSQDCNYSLVIWDGKSKGSYANILRALEKNKKIKVYLSGKNEFLDQSQINNREIEFIYRENNGYTASEVVELLKADITGYFSKTQDLNKFLIKKSVIKKEGKIYCPIPKYANLFIENKYKGKSTGIRFKNEFIDWISEKVRLHEIPKKYEQMEMSFN